MHGHITKNCREKLRQDGISFKYLKELKKRKGKDGKVRNDDDDEEDNEDEGSLTIRIAMGQQHPNPKRKARPTRSRACKSKKKKKTEYEIPLDDDLDFVNGVLTGIHKCKSSISCSAVLSRSAVCLLVDIFTSVIYRLSNTV
jgi:hypothetical protein